MEDLLFLVHRIPYPPNKGDKIRSFHILKQLARSYRIHLGAFIDSPDDWRYVDEVSKLCGETCFTRLNPFAARLRSLKGLFHGQPLTLPYYFDRRMQDWVERVVAETGVSRVFIFSSAMAQYVRGSLAESMQSVIDFVDVDSDKWSQYSRKKSWPMSWIYRREAQTLLAYDREVAAEADASTFVSAAECELFTHLAPETRQRVCCIENGVDVSYFTPEFQYENPYSGLDKVLVFVGAMDYWANVDAVTWFARGIFPRIREQIPAACFYIVGSQPDEAVRRLGNLAGVTVTGAVQDIRPYLAHSSMSVATMRIARGVQNKVLEAMAMAKPVLATTAATQGLVCEPGSGLMVSDEAAELASLAVGFLGATPVSGNRLRQMVCNRYSWENNLAGIERLLEGVLPDSNRRDGNQSAVGDDKLSTPVAQ